MRILLGLISEEEVLGRAPMNPEAQKVSDCYDHQKWIRAVQAAVSMANDGVSRAKAFVS